jgi:hypothetical protein
MTARAWHRLLDSLRPAPPIADAEALRTFLEERAALIAQKCAIDYCRGKTGLASYALFTEEPFLKALEVCRWESFVAVLADLFIIAEGQLRPHVARQDAAQVCERLTALYASALESLPVLAHRPEGWGEVLASFSVRLRAAAALDEPQQALDVADHSAERLFETLPIHKSMRELDEEVVYGAVRFRMIAVSQELRRRIAGPELAKELSR